MTTFMEAGTRPPGPAVLPGEDGWDDARQAWNLCADQRPAAVALPRTADDVVALVRFARAHGLRVAAQSTGHSAARLGALDDVILVRTSEMRGVSVDPAAAIARAEGGARWADVAAAAGAHGLAALAGSSPTVGVVGYSLGGGVGWLGRRYGLACNSVVAVEMVTADGRLVRADRDHEPDLFWAARGGGGSFGVVTAIEMALYPVAEIEAGALLWPIERAAEVLGAWHEWSADLPDEVTTLGRLLRVPPLPDVPEPLRGRAFAVVEVFDLTGPEAAEERLRPLRALGPEMDTVATIPASALGAVHMDPEDPVPALGDGLLLDELPAAALAAFVAAAGPDSGSPLISVEVRRLGGALARPTPECGALAAVDAAAAVFGVGIAAGPEMAAAAEAGVEAVRQAFAPWTSARTLMTWAERPSSPQALFGDAAAARLGAIRARVDPGGLFVADHPVPPAG